MDEKSRLALGFVISFVGVALIIWSIVDLLAKWNRLPGYVGLIGLVIAAIGRGMNARNLAARKGKN